MTTPELAFPPPVLPTNNTDLTPAPEIHPGLHNNANAAINLVVGRLVQLIEEVATIELTPGSEGAPGASAYQVAVTNGFVGTETEWLASLEGPAGVDGADGSSAYAVLVERAGVALGTNAAGQTDFTYYELTGICLRGLMVRLVVTPDGVGTYDLDLRAGVGATPGEQFLAATAADGVYDISVPIYLQGDANGSVWIGIKNTGTTARTYTVTTLRVEKFA